MAIFLLIGNECTAAANKSVHDGIGLMKVLEAEIGLVGLSKDIGIRYASIEKRIILALSCANQCVNDRFKEGNAIWPTFTGPDSWHVGIVGDGITLHKPILDVFQDKTGPQRNRHYSRANSRVIGWGNAKIFEEESDPVFWQHFFGSWPVWIITIWADNSQSLSLNSDIRSQLSLASMPSVDQKANRYTSQSPSSDSNPLFWSSVFQTASDGMQWFFKYAAEFVAIGIVSIIALGGASLLLGLLGNNGILPSILLWLGCLWAIYHVLEWASK